MVTPGQRRPLEDAAEGDLPAAKLQRVATIPYDDAEDDDDDHQIPSPSPPLLLPPRAASAPQLTQTPPTHHLLGSDDAGFEVPRALTASWAPGASAGRRGVVSRDGPDVPAATSSTSNAASAAASMELDGDYGLATFERQNTLTSWGRVPAFFGEGSRATRGVGYDAALAALRGQWTLRLAALLVTSLVMAAAVAGLGFGACLLARGAVIAASTRLPRRGGAWSSLSLPLSSAAVQGAASSEYDADTDALNAAVGDASAYCAALGQSALASSAAALASLASAATRLVLSRGVLPFDNCVVAEWLVLAAAVGFGWAAAQAFDRGWLARPLDALRRLAKRLRPARLRHGVRGACFVAAASLAVALVVALAAAALARGEERSPAAQHPSDGTALGAAAAWGWAAAWGRGAGAWLGAWLRLGHTAAATLLAVAGGALRGSGGLRASAHRGFEFAYLHGVYWPLVSVWGAGGAPIVSGGVVMGTDKRSVPSAVILLSCYCDACGVAWAPLVYAPWCAAGVRAARGRSSWLRGRTAPPHPRTEQVGPFFLKRQKHTRERREDRRNGGALSAYRWQCMAAAGRLVGSKSLPRAVGFSSKPAHMHGTRAPSFQLRGA